MTMENQSASYRIDISASTPNAEIACAMRISHQKKMINQPNPKLTTQHCLSLIILNHYNTHPGSTCMANKLEVIFNYQQLAASPQLRGV